MPETLKNMLTDPSFDVSQLTWEQVVEMVKFWISRCGQPRNALHAWCQFLKNNDTLYSRYVNALSKAMEPPPTGLDDFFSIATKQTQADIDASEFIPLVLAKTETISEIGFNIPKLENFDHVRVEFQHGKWPHFRDKTFLIY